MRCSGSREKVWLKGRSAHYYWMEINNWALFWAKWKLLATLSFNFLWSHWNGNLNEMTQWRLNKKHTESIRINLFLRTAFCGADKCGWELNESGDWGWVFIQIGDTSACLQVNGNDSIIDLKKVYPLFFVHNTFQMEWVQIWINRTLSICLQIGKL